MTRRVDDSVYKVIAAWLDALPEGSHFVKADAVLAASHVEVGQRDFQVECALERERDAANRVIFAYTTRHKSIPLEFWCRYGGNRVTWKRGNYLRTNTNNPYSNWWKVPGLLAARDAAVRRAAGSEPDFG